MVRYLACFGARILARLQRSARYATRIEDLRLVESNSNKAGRARERLVSGMENPEKDTDLTAGKCQRE